MKTMFDASCEQNPVCIIFIFMINHDLFFIYALWIHMFYGVIHVGAMIYSMVS